MSLLSKLAGGITAMLPSARGAAAGGGERAPSPQQQASSSPEPAAQQPSGGGKALQELTPEELEEVKQELVNEAVNKVAGEENEKLENFLEPELITAPYDPRFPNRNQARHCFVRFNEFFKCAHERGEEHPRCVFYQHAYQSLCPADWVENWQELRENGLWTGKY